MQLEQRLDSARFHEDLSVLRGMKIGRVWLGYADALFLECGRLKKERILPASSPLSTVLIGQVTFMLDCQWRIENRFTVVCGRDSRPRKLSHRAQKMVGLSIESVEATGRVPELAIALRNGQFIRTFKSYEGPPRWSVGFRDPALLDIQPEWQSNDVSVWLCFEDRSFMRHYCFDEVKFRPRKFLRQYGVWHANR